MGDAYEIHIAVLPTFIALAEIDYSLLEATENSEALKSFYIGFKADAFNLHSALHIWGAFETLQRLSTDEYEDDIWKELPRVLYELENRVLSWKGTNVRVCKSLGLQRKEGDIYSKLRLNGPQGCTATVAAAAWTLPCGTLSKDRETSQTQEHKRLLSKKNRYTCCLKYRISFVPWKIKAFFSTCFQLYINL